MQHKLCCVNLTKLVWYNMKNMVEVGQHEKRLIEHPCTLYIPYGESHHEMREGSENKYARPPSFSPHCPPCHAVKSPLAHINVWVRSLETWYIGIAYWERIFFPLYGTYWPWALHTSKTTQQKQTQSIITTYREVPILKKGSTEWDSSGGGAYISVWVFCCCCGVLKRSSTSTTTGPLCSYEQTKACRMDSASTYVRFIYLFICLIFLSFPEASASPWWSGAFDSPNNYFFL